MTDELWREFYGPNAGYLLDLYERYQEDPTAVDESTRRFFATWQPPEDGDIAAATLAQPTATPTLMDKAAAAANYAQAIREYGHLAAQLDPLGEPGPGDPSLVPEKHGVTEAELRQLPASIIGGPLSAVSSNAWEATERLKQVYCATVGHDYDHIRLPEEREWLRDAAEAGRYRPPNKLLDNIKLLKELTQVEVFEQFIHRTFPGKHRFSIEGVDILVPIINQILAEALLTGNEKVILGMAHRGRLNVLAHVLNKPYRQMLAEFKDPGDIHEFRDDLGWTGDVKYHLGAHLSIVDGSPQKMTVTVAPNPSHLEAVNPVVVGMARACGMKADHPGAPEFDPAIVLPIMIHGDAAFPGQGIVAETLNLSQLPGYWAGGTVHIITNNQLGYTTEPHDSRSTLYASDLAKGFKIPIIHVNADDPEACIEVARIAFAYQQQFEKDFLIDLIGYRRYGHNEGDEPAFTQPILYQTVQNHPTVRKIWTNRLIERRVIDESQAESMVSQYRSELQRIYEALDPQKDFLDATPEVAPPGTARRVKTGVAMRRLRDLNEALLAVPDGFTVHSKLVKNRERRQAVLNNADEAAIEWANAEELAFATILADGTPIRFTGQDVQRGTFNQRHAVLHDAANGQEYTPLQNIPQAKASFEIHNSPLSENAVLGFEYGYNVQEPSRLVLWEAQYGDFINGAHTIVDEFITSARAKWGQTPSLVLLLPHGYEGAGPDHSSGRLERFLEAAAETNLRIANCTTAAQYFHLLRRQAQLLKTDPLPLVVMTPKSLLRHKLVASSLRDLAEGSWQPVIDDPKVDDPDAIRRIVLCSGKVYVDLVSHNLREQTTDTAIVRIEQLYPFPAADLKPILERYTQAEAVVWVQEEPENMGAWNFVRPLLHEQIGGRLPLHYVGRKPSSSPAEGSSSWHALNQEALIKQAYSRESGKVTAEGFIWEI